MNWPSRPLLAPISVKQSRQGAMCVGWNINILAHWMDAGRKSLTLTERAKIVKPHRHNIYIKFTENVFNKNQLKSCAQKIPVNYNNEPFMQSSRHAFNPCNGGFHHISISFLFGSCVAFGHEWGHVSCLAQHMHNISWTICLHSVAYFSTSIQIEYT